MVVTNPYDKQFLQQLLVCPICKGKLDFSTKLICCSLCRLQFHQNEGSYFDLLPPHFFENLRDKWEERQREMKEWYRNLIANPEEAVKCFMNDYTPYAPLLAKLSGLILDIGGGNGIVRHFLSDATQYIVIDPNLDWLGAKWANIAEHFPCLKTRPCFIRGIGEYLPFQAHSIDIALSFWSLNHTSQPEKVFCEIYQVLRPGGIFLLVLENMEPRWRDMLSPTFISKGLSYTKGILKKKLSCVLGDQEWPLQTDHIRIRESDILKWISGSFKISWRKWIGEYLTFELRKA